MDRPFSAAWFKKNPRRSIVPTATLHLRFVSWKLNREIWNKHQFNLDFWKFAFVLNKFYVGLRSRILTCARPSVWSAITLGHRLQRRKLCPPFGCLCETPVTFWCLAGLKTIARTWVQLQQTRAIAAICFSPICGKYWFDAQTILPPTFIKKGLQKETGVFAIWFLCPHLQARTKLTELRFLTVWLKLWPKTIYQCKPWVHKDNLYCKKQVSRILSRVWRGIQRCSGRDGD